jgi:rhodanese-related sulfurtransferase
MEHSPGFLKLISEARARVKEVAPEQARERLARNPKAVLLDVREDKDWQKGHAAQAVHLSKGVLERDLERMIPDPDTELLLYCGGGFLSVLAADVAQKLGYRNVASVAGGCKALVQSHWPMKSGE